MYKILRDNARQAGTLFAELDSNFITFSNAIIKIADPDLTIKGYANATTAEPTTPATDDCYLVIEAGTIWGEIVGTNDILRWNGSAWEVLPMQLTDINTGLIKVKIITENSGDFTIGTAHINRYLRVDYPTDVIVTVPLDSTATIPVGTIISLIQAGVGNVTLKGETIGVDTVTLNAADDKLMTLTTFQGMQIIKVGANEWDVIGGTDISGT